MPQFDTYSYLTQITTLSISFWILYFFSIKFVVVPLIKVIKFRKSASYSNKI